ncbi:hypothetical protein JDS91_00460 [Bacillus cereus]|uniref:hypothetical protein n=1 Tax=Bacillus cereus TaxID=1396 RepID=UPI0018F4F27A|nr:hypothetical protein [Bacillus cereus]
MERFEYEHNIESGVGLVGVDTILGTTQNITNLAVGASSFVTLSTFLGDGTEQIINYTLEPDTLQVHVNKVIAKTKIEWEVHVYNAGTAAVPKIQIKPLILKIRV